MFTPGGLQTWNIWLLQSNWNKHSKISKGLRVENNHFKFTASFLFFRMQKRNTKAHIIKIFEYKSSLIAKTHWIIIKNQFQSWNGAVCPLINWSKTARSRKMVILNFVRTYIKGDLRKLTHINFYSDKSRFRTTSFTALSSEAPTYR